MSNALLKRTPCRLPGWFAAKVPAELALQNK